MLKQQATIFRRISITFDFIVLAISFMLAYQIRKTAGAVGELHDYVWLLLFAIPLWFILSNGNKLYTSLRLRSYISIVLALLKVNIVCGILLASIIFLLDPHQYSRLLFLNFLLFNFLLMSATKVLIKFLLIQFRRKGFNTRNFLIVGAGDSATNLSELISEHNEWGLNITSLSIEPNSNNSIISKAGKQNSVTSIEEIVTFCKENVVDEVIFAMDKNSNNDIETFVEELQALGLTVRVILDFTSISKSKKEVTLFFDEIPMLTYVNFSLNANQILAKRCLDILGGLVGVFINLLILPFIALAIKIDSPGPVFFVQSRVGENGRRFKCWKFRTMFLDAEAEKQKLMTQNEMKGAMFKMKNDPRITRVGKFLRSSSLDEFPQFWNVLSGVMSLVGTRPPTPDEVSTYKNWHHKRISIKPGITGLWQISGRNQVQDFDDVVRLDIQYIEDWSIWLDIKILLKTPWVMISRKGAS